MLARSVLAAGGWLLLAKAPGSAGLSVSKPNIVFFLTDDYGHYDVGYTNPDANTPNLVQLAREGVVLNHHYVYQYCSPTRSSFLSGRLPLHVNEANHPTSELGGVDLRMATVAEKLKQAGYNTTVSGKWHGGGYLEGQLPIHRGFDSGFGYLNGFTDHYTQYFKMLKGVDLWEDNGPAYGKNGTYGGFMYTEHVVKFIENHDVSRPLFAYVPFQNTHEPLEVPDSYLNKSISNSVKQTYFGMATFMDESIGNITKALKAKGMWENTLVVWSADNGGPTDDGGNNWPFRGGKYTDFQGGVQVVALVAGGFLPTNVRGTSTDAVIHICDWFATFAALAGVNASDAPADVPASDSIDVWPALTVVNGTTKRTEVPLSKNSLIVGRHKIVTKQGSGGKNNWQNPEWPEGKSTPGPACDPCVFDILSDPSERDDLSQSQPSLAKQLLSRLSYYQGTAFQTGADGYQGVYNNCTSLDHFLATHGGFLGPLCTRGPAPPTPPPPSGSVKLSDPNGDCLSVAVDKKKDPVTVSKCGAPGLIQSWQLDKNHKNYVTQDGLCMRPVPYVPGTCKVGTSIIVGACPSGVGVEFDNGLLRSTACAGLCVGLSATGHLAALINCSDPSASQWSTGTVSSYP